MPISFSCNDCGSKYKVADAAAGKKVKCKKCGTVMAIPSLVPAGNDDSGPSLGFRDDAPAPKPAPTPKARPAGVPQPTAKPSAPRANPATARSASPSPARPKPPAVKRPAPPPPPADDNSLDDLAALAHGDLLPPEELPTAPASPAPVYRPPAASAPGRAAPLGYVTPRRVVLEQPAYISQYGGMLIMATFIAPVINTIIRLFVILQAVPAGASINYGALGMGLIFALVVGAVFLCFVAAILLVGIKIAGKIMKFDTEPGGFKNVLMIMGLPAMLGVLSTALGLVLPEDAMEMRIILAVIIFVISMAGMVKLLKDAFVLNWAQTAVAGAMAIGSVIAVIVAIALAVGVMIGGISRLL